jgi:lysophospholipase L1-like esterase
LQNPPPPPGGLNLTGKTLIFAGDSITVGFGGSSWTTPLTANYGGTQINLANNGQLMENMGPQEGCNGTPPPFDPTLVATYNSLIHGALFIAYGTNDIGRVNGETSSGEFYTTYLDNLEYLHDVKGWPYNKIVLVTPYYITSAGYNLYLGVCGCTNPADNTRFNDFTTKVRDLAALKSTRLMDINNWFNQQPDPASLLVDGVHPNATGYSGIVNFMIQTINAYN